MAANEITLHPTRENWYLVSVDLIVNPDRREVCLLSDTDLEFDTDRVVRVNIPLPESFFEPIMVNINTPEALVSDVAGDISQVEIPISVNDNTAPVVIKENLYAQSKRNGVLLTILKKIVEKLEGSNTTK